MASCTLRRASHRDACGYEAARSSPMIIHNLDAVRAGLRPDETRAPAIVDANAKLSGPMALDGFQAVARRPTQRVERGATSNMSSLRATTFSIARYLAGHSPSLKRA